MGNDKITTKVWFDENLKYVENHKNFNNDHRNYVSMVLFF